MKRTHYSIILLVAILILSGRIYYTNWKTRKNIKEFVESEEFEEPLDLRDEKKEAESTDIPHSPKESPSGIHDAKEELVPTTSFNVDRQLSFTPIPVKTHKQSSKMLFLQDESHHLCLYNKNGKKIWSRPLGERLKTEIIPIDIYKNNKIQYLFATKTYLYLIDYNGNRVAKYPTKLKANTTPDKLSVIDYSNNRNYRIFLSKESGNLYLMDKWGRPLEGWKPKELESKLVDKAEHLRIGKRDYLISVHDNGMVYLFNRKGGHYPNFPLKTPTGITSFIISKGTTKANTYFYVISEEGVLFKFNINGKKNASTHNNKKTKL